MIVSYFAVKSGGLLVSGAVPGLAVVSEVGGGGRRRREKGGVVPV